MKKLLKIILVAFTMLGGGLLLSTQYNNPAYADAINMTYTIAPTWS